MQRFGAAPRLSRQLLDRPVRCTFQAVQTRTILNFFRRKKAEADPVPQKSANPVLDEYLRQNKGTVKPERPAIVQGGLASTSIFDQVDGNNAQQTSAKTPSNTIDHTSAASHAAVALDPRPRARERWQRKMLIRDMQRNGRLTNPQFIKRTERELTYRSPNFKTSTKKLGPLARQIAGKTVDEAIVQMKFSKKSAAKDVLAHLEYARDQAIVSRGMGLGAVSDAQDETDGEKGSSQVIRLKDGRKRVVKDASEIYISQAWVGRGPYGRLPDFRARGQVNMMRPPWSNIGLELKEEATRVREHADREKKRLRRRTNKVWVPLPDRALVGQRQWYSW